MYTLQNMSVPSRSRITAIINPVSKVYIFEPMILRDYFKLGDSDKLAEPVIEYINSNKSWQDNIYKPSSYMLSMGNDSSIDMYHDHEECKDINMIIYVFSKTVGDLYIPNREIEITEEKFIRRLYFLKSEVFNDK